MIKGRVINLCGGVYKVLLDDNTIISAKARGKLRSEKVYLKNANSLSQKLIPQKVKNSPKVGDIVNVDGEFIISYDERKNELIRPDISNVDQILLVFAFKEPTFSFYLLDLFILNVIKNNITPIIVITKIDKGDINEILDFKEKMAYYEKMGYKVYYVDSINKIGTDMVIDALKNKITILSGQTGAGKSTLINSIIPGFNLETQEISNALGRGKHTTREISLYQYNGGLIGDSPGFSKLDALGIVKADLNELFVEFKDYKCKFKDCNHQKGSVGCAIIDAVDNGEILPSRYNNYLKLYNDLKR